MKNKLHIALILPSALPIPAVKGGAIETIVTLFMDINEIEKRVIFEVFCVRDEEAEQVSEKYQFSHIHYLTPESISLWAKGKRFARRMYKRLFNESTFTVFYYKEVFSECKKINPDYIVAEGGNYPEFRCFTDYFGKERVFLHLHHNQLYIPSLQGIFGATISVSDFIKNAWEESCAKAGAEKEQKNYVVRNAVDEELFRNRITSQERRELRKKYGIRDDDILLLYLGRIIPEKGVLELIKAVVEIDNPKVKLLVVGNIDFAIPGKSEYFDIVKALIAENSERIKKEGYVDNKIVYQYAQSADIRVLPSQCEEAGSLALIEAILCHTPMIVTNSGSMPETVCEDGAVVVEKGERLTDNLTKVILHMISKPEKMKIMRKSNQEHAKTISKMRFYNDFINVFFCNTNRKDADK